MSISSAADNGLKTDLYELTMAAGYFQNNVQGRAVFELSCHTMPENRCFLVACGLEQAVDYILNLRFSDEQIRFLKSLPVFQGVPQAFFEYLRDFRFTGDVRALPEGEVFFAGEPIVQVDAPILEAQILETYLLSIVNIESLAASKAARVVWAAGHDGKTRGVVDFGSRRAHGPEAAILAARASYIAGCLGTSNVYAGQQFDIPLYGTMAHSWIEAFDEEQEAFRRYREVFPQNTILLIDTYDSIRAVEKIIQAGEKIQGVRLDSGDLAILSKNVRALLDQAGLKDVKIIASGNLNEYKILDLVKAQAPIDAFGVGTDMVTSRDSPALDLTYKLVQITEKSGEVKFKAKHSQGKKTVPGRKQIFRRYTADGRLEADTVGFFSESVPPAARPLLEPVIVNGKLERSLPKLEKVRAFALERRAALPPGCFSLNGKGPVRLEYSQALRKTMT